VVAGPDDPHTVEIAVLDATVFCDLAPESLSKPIGPGAACAVAGASTLVPSGAVGRLPVEPGLNSGEERRSLETLTAPPTVLDDGWYCEPIWTGTAAGVGDSVWLELGVATGGRHDDREAGTARGKWLRNEGTRIADSRSRSSE
jgi:hypothetical protein